MRYTNYIVLFLALWQSDLFSQDHLRVSRTRFGHTKTYELMINDVLEYRLKGETRFQKQRIAAMRDSNIMLDNATEIRLNQIRALRIRPNRHLTGTFTSVFIAGGVGFITLNTINNLITNTSPVFNEKVAYVSAGLLGAGLLIREIGIKRIRLGKNTDLKILNIDFRHMGADSVQTSK